MRVFKILLAIVLIGGSIGFAQERPPAKVVTAKVVRQEVAENQSVIGTLYYERVSHVSTEVAGLVESVLVNEGDYIKKGAPLIRLNIEILEKEIALIRIRIEQIQLRIQHSEKNYQRMKELYSKGGVSEKSYEDALYTYQDLQKEKQVTQETLEKFLIQKRRSVIKAPFDGVVLEKNIDSGDWVQQGRQLVRIGATNELFVKAPVAETLLKFVTRGQKVPVTIHAFDQELTGTIEDVSPIADAKTKNIFLKIKISPLKQVAENMSATVFVPVSTKRKLSIIPRDALVKFQGKDFVYTVKEKKAAILPVNIVTYLGDTVGVDNPYIVAGMSVVVEGNERLRPDQPVTVAGEK